MKYIFTALLTAGVLVGTASAQYTFGEFDTDGDGQVGSGEFGEVYENDLYSTFDVDGDGVIDQNEFGTGLYNTFDADNDGVLTESEYTTGVETFYGGDYSLAYSDFDTDGDGEVTEEEFSETYDSEGLFDTFDADGNDEIADGEFGEGLFGLVDENDDGFFTEEEYQNTPILFGDAPSNDSELGSGVTRGEEVNNPDEVGFLGGIFGDANYEAYEDYDGPGAAMSVSFSTPNEKNVNFSITGPNGYRNSIEVGYYGLETGGDARVLEDLTPGVYSVAATDDNLQLVRTNLELRVSSLIPLNFNMQLIEDFDYNIADYEPYEAYGTYGVGAYSPVDVASGGNITVITSTSDGAEDVEILGSITGPDDFIQDFEGSERVFTGLTEGPYSVAATAEGYGMVEGIVESREGQVVEVTLTLEPLDSPEDDEGDEDD